MAKRSPCPLSPIFCKSDISMQYMWNNKYDEEGFWISHDDVALACNISGTANIISVVSRETAFDIVFCRKMILAVYHHGATFEGLADEFNDEHCKGISFWICHNKSFAIDYDQVDEQRTKINRQRVADAFFLYSFLDLNER